MPNTLSGNAGIAAAVMHLAGVSAQVVTADGAGNYSFSGLLNGQFSIIPLKSGFSFTPTEITVQIVGSVGALNFVATANTAKSSIDSRVPPNSKRTVQGTDIDDVQSASNATEPVDSRTAGPEVDSRITPNIPINSRITS
jgi:hypothetical protein